MMTRTNNVEVLRACLRSKTLALALAEERIRILESRLTACQHSLDVSVGGEVYFDEVRRLRFREAELERLVLSLRKG
jgi:hypothetical protein